MTGSPGRTQRTLSKINKMLTSFSGFGGDIALMLTSIILLSYSGCLLRGLSGSFPFQQLFGLSCFKYFRQIVILIRYCEKSPRFIALTGE